MRRLLLAGILFLSSPLARAELPPSAYEAMQAQAPECLRIQVLKVSIQSGEIRTEKNVKLTASVLNVARTASGLKDGDIITINYLVRERSAGWVGPGQVPVLAEGAVNVAYLEKIANSNEYQPAAGIMTFSHF